MKNKFKNKNAFTIVELVIVIAVIAILAAVLIPTFSSIVQSANRSKALQQATNVHKNIYAGSIVQGAVDNTVLRDGMIYEVNDYVFAGVDNSVYELTYCGDVTTPDADNYFVFIGSMKNASNSSMHAAFIMNANATYKVYSLELNGYKYYFYVAKDGFADKSFPDPIDDVNVYDAPMEIVTSGSYKPWETQTDFNGKLYDVSFNGTFTVDVENYQSIDVRSDTANGSVQCYLNEAVFTGIGSIRLTVDQFIQYKTPSDNYLYVEP